MSKPKSRDRVGASPGKLALMGVLALVLVGVIASNWPGGEDVVPALASTAAGRERPAPPSAGAATARANSSGTPQSERSDNPFGEFATDDNWSAPPLREVTRFDPLAIAKWASPVQAEAEGDILSEEQMQELLTAQNAIIFMSGDTRLARIGDREFRVGDVIGHYRISEISSQGVVLSDAE